MPPPHSPRQTPLLGVPVLLLVLSLAAVAVALFLPGYGDLLLLAGPGAIAACLPWLVAPAVIFDAFAGYLSAGRTPGARSGGRVSRVRRTATTPTVCIRHAYVIHTRNIRDPYLPQSR